MASHESLIAEALKLDRSRMSRYCHTVDPNFLAKVNSRKPKTMAQLADIWYTSHGASYGRNQPVSYTHLAGVGVSSDAPAFFVSTAR